MPSFSLHLYIFLDLSLPLLVSLIPAHAEEAEGSNDEDEVVAKKATTNEMAAGELVSGMGYAAVCEVEGFDLSLDSSDSDSELGSRKRT